MIKYTLRKISEGFDVIEGINLDFSRKIVGALEVLNPDKCLCYSGVKYAYVMSTLFTGTDVLIGDTSLPSSQSAANSGVNKASKYIIADETSGCQLTFSVSSIDEFLDVFPGRYKTADAQNALTGLKNFFEFMENPVTPKQLFDNDNLTYAPQCLSLMAPLIRNICVNNSTNKGFKWLSNLIDPEVTNIKVTYKQLTAFRKSIITNSQAVKVTSASTDGDFGAKTYDYNDFDTLSQHYDCLMQICALNTIVDPSVWVDPDISDEVEDEEED